MSSGISNIIEIIISRFIIPIVLIAGGVGFFAYLKEDVPPKKEDKKKAPTIEVYKLKKTDYQIKLASRGNVYAHRESTLSSEVSAKVTKIYPALKDGAFFKKDDPLIELDKSNYKIALNDAEIDLNKAKNQQKKVELDLSKSKIAIAIAEAKLIQVNLDLTEEKARSAQALKDWNDLYPNKKPDDLVIRKPQLASAKAKVDVAEADIRQAKNQVEIMENEIESAKLSVDSAKSRVEKAELDIDRCIIKAPYDGRVLSHHIEIGQFVNTNTRLADIYATDFVEIRLPLSYKQLAFIDLPEAFTEQSETQLSPKVDLFLSYGNKKIKYEAKVVRTEAAIDQKSRQLFVIARVDKPYERNDGKPPLKIGNFVQADIYGHLLEDVFIIPRDSIKNDEVIVISKDNKASFRKINAIWKGVKNIIVKDKFEDGDRISKTAIRFARNKSIDVEIIDTPKKSSKKEGQTNEDGKSDK